MKIKYSPTVLKTIAKTATYIESINTEGSGNRWALRLIDYISSFAHQNTHYALCKHASLARYNYQCIVFNDWVIAFKVTGNTFEVRRIIYGLRLG